MKKEDKVRREFSEVYDTSDLDDERVQRLIEEPADREAHLKEISRLSRRRRGPLHWTAFTFSLVSLAILIAWIVSSQTSVPLGWVSLDIGLGIFFAIEFFTRSGFRWNWIGYLQSRFFDFIAIAPALALVYYRVPYEGIWIWIILAARAVRMIDRLLGDGFVRRNALALLEGFEEEITDRVLLRIIARVEADLYRGSFTHGAAKSLERNKSSLLGRIQDGFPRQGLGANLARLTGLDAALERAEERIFEAIVNILDSPEVDQTVREAIDSAFIVMKQEIGKKTWRERVGIQRKPEE